MNQQHLELNDTRPAQTANWKACTQCGISKPPDAYYLDTNYSDNHAHKCKRCDNLLNSLRRSDYYPRLRQRLYEKQNGLCPVCDQPIKPDDRIALDHPHSTEAMHDVHTLAAAMTGLLHLTCNVGLGMLYDDPVVLRRAARYIEQTRGYGQQTLDLWPNL